VIIKNIAMAIEIIGDSICKNAVQLSLNDDVTNLCEFSQRVGKEVISAEIRMRLYGDNSWLVGPRDGKILSFVKDGESKKADVIIAPAIRNAAIVLYFSVPLRFDQKFQIGANALIKYIGDNELWSFKDTERVRNSEADVPFNFWRIREVS
jgi:hypothetical protein